MNDVVRSQERYDRVARRLEWPMNILGLLFIPVIIIPMTSELSHGQTLVFVGFEVALWAAFVAEYVTLLYLAPDRRHMVRTHLFDLAVIILPAFRPLRALRALRVLAVIGRSIESLGRVMDRPVLRTVGLVTFIAISVGGVTTWELESRTPGATIESIGDGIWWALVTTTTVGYGDTFPVTTGGKVIAAVLMLVGVGIVGTITATVAAKFVEDDESAPHAELVERLDRIEALLAERAVSSTGGSTEHR